MTKTIYLTIDDAPSADCINKLNHLDKYNIRAVWFAEGKRMEEYPDAAVEILRRGHILANHALTHPNFSAIALEQAYDEISRTDAILKGIYQQAGVEWQQRFFRFPFGDKGDGRYENGSEPLSAEGQARHSAIQNHLRRLGYTQPAFSDITYRYYRQAGLLDDVDWYWTYDSHDWCPYSDRPTHGVDSVEKVLARMDEDVPEGWRGLNYPGSADIFLMHDHITPDNIFMQIIDKLVTKNVTFKLPGQ